MPQRLTDRPLSSTAGAALFDLDGTLLDSENFHFESTAEVLARRGIALSSADFDLYAGWEELATWTHINQRFGVADDPLQLASERTEAFVALLTRRRPKLLPGVTEILLWLSQRGLPLAVASSLPRAQIEAALDSAGLTKFFAVRKSGHDDVALGKGKPCPDVYIAAAAALGLDADACVAFEDSIVGLRSARAAGCYVIAVTSTLPATVGEGLADCVCSTMTDALEFLRTSIK